MPVSEPDSESQPQRHFSPSLSSLLLEFAAHCRAERVRVSDITESLGKRSFGFILLIFALPNSLPVVGIPGVSTITGLPLLLASLQMMLGHQRVYLPRWIANSSMATADFQRLIHKVAPWLKRIERLMKPRLSLLTRGYAEPLLGACCALLAFLLILPIPFGNLLPGLGILFIALGLIERDGLCTCAGLTLGIASWVYLSGLVWVIIQTAISMIDHFF